MNNLFSAFISLLKNGICGGKGSVLIDGVDLGVLFKLSKYHDLAHIVCLALKAQGNLPDDETGKNFSREYDYALMRYLSKEIALEKTKKLFDEAKIPYVVLKGAAIMELYPEKWMRTCLDIDVLVKEDDHRAASELLSEAGYKKTASTDHDVTFQFVNGVRIELHHTLIEDYRFPKASEMLKNVWDHVSVKERGRSEYMLDDAMFYFYHVAHMVKHFEKGGCGVRSYIDLWLLDNVPSADKEGRDRLLKAGGILTFADYSRKIAAQWFSNGEEDPYLSDVECFVIEGGLYGSPERAAAISKTKTGSRFKYYLKRTFLPYNELKYTYPVLKKAPILLPFCWIARLFRVFDSKTRKIAADEIRRERTADVAAGKKIKLIMEKLDIW